MKKADTWMPLYIGDYLADTARLTTEQHGAYLLLLMDYWRNGPPPDDEAVLASIAKLSTQQWRKHAATLREFFAVQLGRWVQGRADAERVKANGVSGTRSAAGKAGADARWSVGKGNGKPDGSGGGKPKAKRMAKRMANASQNDAPSPSQSEKEPPPQSGDPPRAAARVPPSKPDGVSDQVWTDWLALRKAKKAPVTPTVLAGAEAEAHKAGMPLDAFLAEWCRRGTQGLKADWLVERRGAVVAPTFRERETAAKRREGDAWIGTAGAPDNVIDLEAPNAPRLAAR